MPARHGRQGRMPDATRLRGVDPASWTPPGVRRGVRVPKSRGRTALRAFPEDAAHGAAATAGAATASAASRRMAPVRSCAARA